ncbi:uncharacterized protein [Amphiura filiformis]|uniref:uncharacterized protein n=1 Tax=Amphiura filiformis TaxID=82378 RepID=UPI003B21A868
MLEQQRNYELDRIGINKLGIDELVLIFNLLTLYERLIAMRVSKTWYSILREKSSWLRIDFTEMGPITEKIVQAGGSKLHYNVQWRFPSQESDILLFLRHYGGRCLKEIRIGFFTNTIVDYLREKCPNLRSICGGQLLLNKKDLFYFPANITRCEFESPPTFGDFTHPDDDKYIEGLQYRDEQILGLLSQQARLQYVKLDRFWMSKSAMISLAIKEKPLREFQLINPIVSGKRFGSEEYLDAILSASVGNIVTLKCLRIDCTSTSKRFVSQLCHLPHCVGHFENLKTLALKGIECSNEMFEVMLPGLLNLESLELEGASISSTAVELIGKRIKKLRYLELGNGSYDDECLEYLQCHPALEIVWIYKDYIHRNHIKQSWLSAIFDVVLTLLKVRNVKIEGYRLSGIIDKEKYPKIPELVGIEINNLPEELMCD